MGDPQEVTVPERVLAVYQEVWHEFFEWEQRFCQQTLASLAPSTLQAPSIVAQQGALAGVSTQNGASGSTTYTERDCAQVWYFDAEGDVSSDVLSCATYSCTSLEPGQPYEACTYTHKNIYIADDGCEKLPFMPFSDDPAFPSKELFELYDTMGWGTHKDPDYDVIAAEAARRLHFGFGISYDDIDLTGILPMVIIEQPEKKGLLHMLNQRDMLPWPGSFLSELPPLPRTEGPLPTALRTRVNGIRYLFCANLNCVEPYCPTHLNLDGQLRRPTTERTDGDAKGVREPACGYDCYKYASEETEGLTHWDEAEMDDFNFILEGAADLSSCDLAVLCDKPCRDVYAHRRIHAAQTATDSETSEGDSASDSSSVDDEKPVFDDVLRGSRASGVLPPIIVRRYANIWERATPKLTVVAIARICIATATVNVNYPVGAGPRDAGVRTTERRGAGQLDVRVSRRAENVTLNFARSVAQNATKNNGCRNHDLQHGKSKALEVKEGAYGLGLFLIETAREGDLIGEYVGEILSDKMTDARGVLTRYLGRNYLFGLNEEWTIDAALVGNETRFINHAPGTLANCRAEVREVNGDHRIGIYAIKKTIHPGEELFMDYGKEYFTGGVKGGTPKAHGPGKR